MANPIDTNHVKIHDVYYVDSPERIMNPIAIDPEIKGDKIWWHDTSRGKSLSIKQIKTEPASSGDTIPKKIEIITKEGFQVTLIKLDLITYNSKVKDRVVGSPSFASDQEVHDFYLHTSF